MVWMSADWHKHDVKLHWVMFNLKARWCLLLLSQCGSCFFKLCNNERKLNNVSMKCQWLKGTTPCETITVFSYLRIRPFVRSGKGISHTLVNESKLLTCQKSNSISDRLLYRDWSVVDISGGKCIYSHKSNVVNNVMLQVKVLTATLYFKSSIIQRQTFYFLLHFLYFIESLFMK